MGDPIKIKDLATKMLYLSGRSPKKNILKLIMVLMILKKFQKN